jgi:hypothetical protein
MSGETTAVICRLPGQARPREEVLEQYREEIAKVRSVVPAVLWEFLAPDPDRVYRWRVQLDCGCIKELFTWGEDQLPTEATYQCDHVYYSKLQPGQTFCDNQEHTRPQLYREIIDWEQRREVTFPPDPVEPRDEFDPEIWVKIRHDAPHTSAFWRVRLVCGHRSEVCTDANWKPEDGPRHVSAERLQEMTAEFEEFWAAQPGVEDDREVAHHRRMLAQGWPRPQTEETCFACCRVRGIVACERVGWLVPPKPKPKEPRLPRPPSKESLQRSLQRAEKRAARLREQLARLEAKEEGTGREDER